MTVKLKLSLAELMGQDALRGGERRLINDWLTRVVQEHDEVCRAAVIDAAVRDPESRAYFVWRAEYEVRQFDRLARQYFQSGMTRNEAERQARSNIPIPLPPGAIAK